MKKLSISLLAQVVSERRKSLGFSQSELAEKTGIDLGSLSELERGDRVPSVDQLLSLSEVLGFFPDEVFSDGSAAAVSVPRKKVAIAGTGYVGLSLAVLLSQHHDVTAVEIGRAHV